MTRELLIAEEVAQVLRVSADRVYDLARCKILPCVRVGRSVRFDREKINSWIDEGGSAWPGIWKKFDK